MNTLQSIATKRNATISRVASEILFPQMQPYCTTPKDRAGMRPKAAAYRDRQLRQLAAGFRAVGPKHKLP